MITRTKYKRPLFTLLFMLIISFGFFVIPIFAQAPQSDLVYNKLTNPNSSVTVNGTPIATNGVIEYADVKEAGFTFSFSFGVPVLGDNPDMLNPTNNPVNKGDATTQILSTGPYVKLFAAQQSSVQMSNGSVPLGTVHFDNIEDDTGHTVRATVIFDGDDGIFDGTYNTVAGSFEMKMELTGITQTSEEQNIPINIFGNVYIVHVPAAEITTPFHKSGVYNNDGTITWTTMVERIQGDTSLSLEGFGFIDDLTDAGQYIEGSFSVNDTPQTPTYNENILSYDFSDVNGPQTIRYQTSVFDIDNPSSNHETAHNTANLIELVTSNRLANSTATVDYRINWIEKSGITDEDYLGNVSTTTWSIVLNHMGASLNNVVVSENLSEGTIVSASYQTGNLQEDSSIVWNGTETPVSPNSETYDYPLGDITTPILMTVTSEVHWENNVFIEKDITNTASLTWENFDGELNASARISIGYNAITKSGSANTSEGTITWNVAVAPKQQSFPNTIIYDVLLYAQEGSIDWDESNLSSAGGLSASALAALPPSYGQALDRSSLRETTATGALVNTYAIRTNDGEQIGDLVVVADVDGNDTLPLSYTYNTYILNPHYLVGNATTITNTATLYSDGVRFCVATAHVTSSDNLIKDTIDREYTGNSNFSAQVDNSAARRTTSFNYIDQTVVFRLRINVNGLVGANIDHSISDYALGNVIFKDILPQGWEFVPFDGTEMYYAIYNTSGNPVTFNDTDLQFSISPEGDSQAATFVFSEGMLAPYTIFLRAKPTDETALEEYFGINGTSSITNTANVYRGDAADHLGSDTANVNIQSNLLSKTVVEDASTGIATWTLEYNPNAFASIPNTITLLDTLGSGIDLRTDSKGNLLFTDDNGNANIHIYEMEIEADGSLRDIVPQENLADENTVEYDVSTRTLRFTIPDSTKAYRYEYVTDVTSAYGTAHNRARFSENAANSLEVSAQYSISQAAAFASMQRNKYIRLQSVEQGNESNLLEDSEFTLFSTAQDNISLADPFRIGLTNEDGECYMGHLPPGEYILQITKPTTGYHPSPTQYVVSVTAENMSINGEPYSPGDPYPVPSIPIRTNTGNLHISNALHGNATDDTKIFSYAVSLPELANGTQLPYIKSDNTRSSLLINNGIANFTLTSGQHIELLNIPENTPYEVRLEGNSADGYATTAENSIGTILEDETSYAHFTHTKNISETPSSSFNEIESSSSDSSSGGLMGGESDRGTPPIPSTSEGLSAQNSQEIVGISASEGGLNAQDLNQNSPQTSDNTNSILWIIISISSLTGIILCICMFKRKNPS